ncbi:NADH-quinone oxidoreductase subunit NuoE [Actinoplanes sp. DH11]|uniref:NADH-quinone oxidoreductase subunit NuoE n=1 Tax=Actinoplanes sp. DH11 TaxID=2857011 RepID=UPI0027145BF2|nr:NADH-quinone oxidoreductase subunit NuoE [Actinoplanes sp. DH11]
MSETTVDFSPAAAPLAEKLLEPAREILARYPAGRERSALLPLLHLVQTEEGYVSPQGVSFCAEILGINKAQVGAVATFYTMYKRRPTGEYLVSVCTNTLCNVLGGQQVYDELAEHLGVGHDQTTADGKITLEHAECLAACDYAPVVTVNYDFTIDEATPESAIALVEGLRQGERPTPARGARICSLKEMQFQLAGFADPRDGAVGDGVAGAPTLRGVRLAQEHGVAVAGFDTDTPITRTKPARDESALPPRTDDADKPVEPKPEGRIASVAKKAAGAVKAAAGAVADKVEDRRHTKADHQVADQAAGHAGRTTDTGDLKDPEVRTAEQRNPTMGEPDRTGGAEADEPAPENPAEAAGVAQNRTAGDGKPAGDTTRGERIVSQRTADQKPDAADPNPGWQNVPRGTEEEK